MRDAGWILAVGCVVSLSPPVWSWLVWPNSGLPHAAFLWLVVFGFSVAPFVLLGALRASTAMTQIAAFVTLLGCSVLVVFGQVAGLNPNDPSSTAVIAVFFVPFYACFGVLVVFALDALVRGVSLFHRARRDPPASV